MSQLREEVAEELVMRSPLPTSWIDRCDGLHPL